MKKVSIIVPVYNTEKYLSKCLNSLVNQTLEEIEIIVVNDGSSDKSLSILEEYKNKYSDKIVLIDKKNEGVSIARNKALEKATGEYIGFADSDDYVELDMFEKLYNKGINDNADIVASGYYEEKEDGKSFEKFLDDEAFYGKKLIEKPELLTVSNSFITSKIFKREFLIKNKLSFSKYNIFEDLLFVYKSYLLANKIVKVNLAFYHYIRRKNVSVTGKFNDKFYDIIPVMNELKEFYVKNTDYNIFSKYITFLAIHHTYLRYVKPVGIKMIYKKYKYIKQTMKFLDEFDPEWRKNEYFKIKKLNRYPYDNAFFFIIAPLGRRVVSKTKKIISFCLRHVACGCYKILENKKINKNAIFIDSQHGNDINGNMFYLIKDLNENSKYNNYKVYVACEKNRITEFKNKFETYNIKNYCLVIPKTFKYFKMLATSKYLFTDTSLPIYFTKRKEQVYLNTWHGTPLKTLGKSVKYDFYNISNVQKNFVIANYVLYPNEFMKDIMIKDYMLYLNNNKYVLSGYPRNGIFKTEKKDKSKKQRIAYMPTWRGTLDNKDLSHVTKTIDILKAIDLKLSDNQEFYINMHPYMKDKIKTDDFKNIKLFPSNFETYDFLNTCDVLITDYSSVFFDYAVSKKIIILFVYDLEEYIIGRGMYLNINDLPFPKVKTIEELFSELDNPVIPYDEFIKEYCNYDSKDNSKKLLELVLEDKTNKMIVSDFPKSSKENCLVLSNSLSYSSVFDKMFDLIDWSSKNYYIGFANASIKDNKYRLQRLEDKCNYFGYFSPFVKTSVIEYLLLYLLKKFNFMYKLNKKMYKKIYKSEYNRRYNNANFDSVLLFDENDLNEIYLYAFSTIKNKCIYFSKISKNINYKILKKYDKIYVTNSDDKEKLINNKIKNEKIVVVDDKIKVN